MSRFDPIYRDTKPIHEFTQDGLYEVVRRLTTVLESGGTPDASTTQDCIAILSSARLDVSSCTDFVDDIIKHTSIADFRISRHHELILWITDVSIALKLQGVKDAPNKPLTLDMLARGKSLIADLESCRKRVRWD